ncbi:PREDICTED: LOW QUALITY PROTEIN: piggyBac transposable element-derived protein 4-like [Habropoda laboriosa]|uniref:LOW QUALITY PROTEIN: piggyBac transposable element-derived protein 4-like n=1 Tax=Habropoda laboriosa TaxID=597456 RepID=UPI00083CE06B|nr:PREDICTED: LOW QUALITY PROTEIN: piggyBac transposable element-derived protein 4-like [Habropoda laboriosa]
MRFHDFMLNIAEAWLELSTSARAPRFDPPERLTGNMKQHEPWLDADETPKHMPKPNLHSRKTLVSVWWSAKDVAHYSFLKKPALVNRRGVLLLHDNARPHIAKQTVKKLAELKCEVLPHPPYSADLSPTDYNFFKHLDDFLNGKMFKEECAIQKRPFHSQQPNRRNPDAIEKIKNGIWATYFHMSSSHENPIVGASDVKQRLRGFKGEGELDSGDELLDRTLKGQLAIDDGEIEEDIADSTENDEWIDVSEVDNIPSSMDFDISPQIAGPQISNNIKEPLDFFRLYFTDTLIDSIIKETNDYANSKLRGKQLSKRSIWNTWSDVNRKEFLAFVGVILNMGTMQVANLQEYWSTKFTSKIPFYSDIFTRDRFQQIFWMLHLQKNAPVGRNTCIRPRIQKANSFLQYINSKFSEHFIPYKSICVDESIIKFKGKICFMTYNPAKPTKWGIRIYVLADSNTGYVYSVLPHYGSITSENLIRPDLPVSSRIPLDLYRKLLDNVPHAKGYHMYTDRYYTSIPLAEELLKMNCFLTGTIKTNRKYLPMVIKKPRFVRGRKTVAHRKGKTLVLAWKDKRTVTLLSTYNEAGLISEYDTIDRRVRGGELVSIQKPKIVIDYTKNMRGVDRADQYAATYCFLRKSLKWWRKLFFRGMEICYTTTEMCIVNSYILYTLLKKINNEKPMSHLKFVKLLVDQLVGNFRQNSTSRDSIYTPNTEGRLNNHLHIIRSGTKKDCVVCSNRKIPGERRQTHYFCDTCIEKPRLHIGDCFKRYHTLDDYKISIREQLEDENWNPPSTQTTRRRLLRAAEKHGRSTRKVPYLNKQNI